MWYSIVCTIVRLYDYTIVRTCMYDVQVFCYYWSRYIQVSMKNKHEYIWTYSAAINQLDVLTCRAARRCFDIRAPRRWSNLLCLYMSCCTTLKQLTTLHVVRHYTHAETNCLYKYNHQLLCKISVQNTNADIISTCCRTSQIAAPVLYSGTYT